MHVYDAKFEIYINPYVKLV